MNATFETLVAEEQARRLYRAVWRWHFYAGIFCIPLVIWLACTGSIYLFKPQIERWLDRSFDHLAINGPCATPEQIARAVLTAVPKSSLHYYELPPSADAATRVIVGVGKLEYRVYVHPQTLQILEIVNEDRRPMKIVFRLHGELLAGDWGSRVVELAASWAIVLIVSGLFLWWPRQSEKLAGVLWIRLRKGPRIFWRDLHAVTGIWVSGFALFLLLTGLPWAKSWGAYFTRVRQVTGTAVARQDWTTGRSSELAEREGMNWNSLAGEAMDHANHMGHVMSHMHSAGGYEGLNRVVPAAATLHLAEPVLITPAMVKNAPWTVKSDAQNRTLRTVVLIDPNTTAIVNREDFNQRHMIDRVLGTGIAAHEGQLFGLANQLLGLATAMGLVTLATSALVLWWRRRHVGVLGAPIPIGRPRWSFALIAVVVALALYLPAMAVSLFTLILFERLLFSRIPSVSRWLGLSAIALIAFTVSATAQPPRDGEILTSRAHAPLPTFESLDDFSRNYFPHAVYDEARTQKNFDVLEITYASDGLPVRGMLIKPKVTGGRKWPAIIFNRGGTGDYSRIADDGTTPCSRENPTCLTVVDLYLLAKAGFVVIASDYRFHGSTAKRDEWGGVDVDDVLNLVPALKSLHFVDPESLYMLGVSRGGTMTYIAIKRGVPVKAAAVVAGPSDLEAFGKYRPEFVNGNENYDGFAKVWPDYEHSAAEYYRVRSAVYWADQINVPVLIMHSRTDKLVPVSQSLRMAEALQEKGKVYALHIYDHDGHSLPMNREDRNRKIIDWFNTFGGTDGARR